MLFDATLMSLMKLVLIEPTSPGPGNPAISRGLLSFVGVFFPEMVEFISVVRQSPRRDPTCAVSTFELIIGLPYFLDDYFYDYLHYSYFLPTTIFYPSILII